jgi:hypothetical protein
MELQFTFVHQSSVMRSELFWRIKQLAAIIPSRRFGTTYHATYSWFQKMEPIGCPETSTKDTTLRSAISQKSAYLICIASKAWNHPGVTYFMSSLRPNGIFQPPDWHKEVSGVQQTHGYYRFLVTGPRKDKYISIYIYIDIYIYIYTHTHTPLIKKRPNFLNSAPTSKESALRLLRASSVFLVKQLKCLCKLFSKLAAKFHTHTHVVLQAL